MATAGSSHCHSARTTNSSSSSSSSSSNGRQSHGSEDLTLSEASSQKAAMKTRGQLERRREQKRKSANKRRKNEKQIFEDLQMEHEELRLQNARLKERVVQLTAWSYCAEFFLDTRQQLARSAPPGHPSSVPQPPPPPRLPLPPPPPATTTTHQSSSTPLSSVSSQEASSPQLLEIAETDVTVVDESSVFEMLLNPDMTSNKLRNPESLNTGQQIVTQEAAMTPEVLTGSGTFVSGTFFNADSFLLASSSSGGTENVTSLPEPFEDFMPDKVKASESMSTTNHYAAVEEAAMTPEVVTGNTMPVSGTPQNQGFFTSKSYFGDVSASSSSGVTGKMSSLHADANEDKNSLLESLIHTYLPNSDEEDSGGYTKLFGDSSWFQEDIVQRAPIPEYTQGIGDTPGDAMDMPFWVE